MGYDAGSNDLAWIQRELAALREWLAELSQPSSGQIYQQLAEIQSLVNDLEARVDALAASGVQWSGPVNTTGNVTAAGTVRGDTGVTSIGAYNRDITYTRRGAWWGNDGRAGYASSSIEKKTLVEGDMPDPLAIMQVCSHLYHYNAEIDKRDNPDNPEYDPNYHVAMEWGAIAEELHALGLWQVVVYEDHVKPVAIHYQMLGLLAIEAAKHVWSNHLDLVERVAKLEKG